LSGYPFWLFVLYDSGSNGESSKHAPSMADCSLCQSSAAINLPRATNACACRQQFRETLSWSCYTKCIHDNIRLCVSLPKRCLCYTKRSPPVRPLVLPKDCRKAAWGTRSAP